MSVRFHQFNMNFFLLDLNNNSKIQDCSLTTTHSARNLGFIIDEHLTFSDQITALSKSCYYHISELRCIRPYLDFKTASTIATSSAGARVLEQGRPWAVWGAHGERVEREPITGVWGRSPQRGPGAEPVVRWVRGRSPPEAESFLALGRATDRANLYPLQYFQQSITIR